MRSFIMYCLDSVCYLRVKCHVCNDPMCNDEKKEIHRKHGSTVLQYDLEIVLMRQTA